MDNPSRSRTRAAIAALVAAGLLTAAVAGPALAKGTSGPSKGGGSTSTLTGPVMVTDLNRNGSADHGDSITFNVSTTATAYPEVGLRCYQGSSWVFDGYVGYFPGYLFNPWFTLDSGYWASGVAASCDARLFYYDQRGREHVLATMTFPVGP